jgi:hypothetical protein
MPGLPILTDIRAVDEDSVELRWDGPAGLYRVMRRMDLHDSQWQEVVGWNTNRAATVTALQAKEFFSVIGPSPNYAGSQSCAGCHRGVHTAVMDTRHAGALETLKEFELSDGTNTYSNWETNSSCLPCHTVGYGLPTGFSTEGATPHLAGVQCESCHGPAGLHVADPFDLFVRPRKEISAQLCGGCHQSVHLPAPFPRPTLPHYDEWSTTPHNGVVFDMNGGRIDRCGRCHSGSSRLAQLEGEDPAITVEGDANLGINCVVCHNPHEATGNGYQLRNPTASQEDYVVTTSGSAAGGGGLLDQYNPDINLCAQCHNHRGASWTSTSRPPHHSPQYNIMLGTVGETPEGYTPRGGGHGRFVSGQCVTCHMQTADHQSEAQPALTGHKFLVELYDACTGCHSNPEGLVDFTTGVVGMRILELKSLLDEWGMNHSPEPLRTTYGALAWEYSNSGDLSEGSGPSGSEQSLIPDPIKKARFNLYLVLYDSSLGVHNGPYASDLLQFAREWVLGEIDGQSTE